MRLTSRKNLYLNQVGGTFIIIYESDEKWFETQLTLTDSRLPDLQCRKNDQVNSDTQSKFSSK